ncbi:aminotransferase class V-fold PLP-dependent enzyme [Spongiimicrobium sp. 3-5]|uniref:aminotransferase class V-fold PLP-dependent enzyme n=1 Tax=Spongiimicrobium sp. 3-5 TaxID=3332596 RepID=UPI003980EA10
MQKFVKEFPVLDQYIYTNTAASGLFYDSLQEWRQEHDLDFLIGGIPMKKKCVGLISETRTAVGTFFGCKRENVALVPNFTLGLNLVLEGLDKRHKVLLLTNDYPSVNWPFESREFEIFYAEINEHLEQNIQSQIAKQQITVLALSLVQWLNGIQIDLDFLKNLKNEYPELIIIADGTQFCGTAEFNFENSGIDVLGASAYKWLLAGHGNGFMLFTDAVKEKLEPKTIGLNAANGMVNGKESIRFAKRFEPGHLDTLSFGSLKFSLDWLSQLGMKKIGDHNKKMSIRTKKIFSEMNLLEDKVILRNTQHSTIFNIRGNDAIYQHLASKDVICSQRADGIRFSFHFYNGENDVDRIVEILKTAL